MDMKERIKEGLGPKILNWDEKRPNRIFLSIDKKDIFAVTEFLFKKLGLRFSIASGMQTAKGFEILYHFSHDQKGELFSLRVLIEEKDKPAIDSITPLFPGAEWVEREIWEMLGIDFTNHPNLKRLLLAEDWPENEYPLRHKER